MQGGYRGCLAAPQPKPGSPDRDQQESRLGTYSPGHPPEEPGPPAVSAEPIHHVVPTGRLNQTHSQPRPLRKLSPEEAADRRRIDRHLSRRPGATNQRRPSKLVIKLCALTCTTDRRITVTGGAAAANLRAARKVMDPRGYPRRPAAIATRPACHPLAAATTQANGSGMRR
jgi:hypothetical protein